MLCEVGAAAPRRLGARPAAALTRLHWGLARRARGERDSGLTLVRRASEEAEAVGLGPVAARARRALEARA